MFFFIGLLVPFVNMMCTLTMACTCVGEQMGTMCKVHVSSRTGQYMVVMSSRADPCRVGNNTDAFLKL